MEEALNGLMHGAVHICGVPLLEQRSAAGLVAAAEDFDFEQPLLQRLVAIYSPSRGIAA